MKKEPDYEAWMKENAPQREKIGSFQQREERRKAAAKTKISIRLDPDILDEFKRLAQDDSYQSLINRALREWLSKQTLKELLREELEPLKEAWLHRNESSSQTSR